MSTASEPEKGLADELLQFLSEADEFVCVAGRRFHRFIRGQFSLRRLRSGLEFQVGPIRLRLAASSWTRTTHRFNLRGGDGAVILKPSRRNEIWLRRQQFRWNCEERASRRWTLVRSSFRSPPAGNGLFLRMVLRKGGCWFVAVAVAEDDDAQAELLVSQLLVFWRQFESSGLRRVKEGLLVVPREMVEAAARLLVDLRAPVRIYCLPDLTPYFARDPPPVPLLWPSQTARAELKALTVELALPAPVQTVVRNGSDCSFEYLGIPFAVLKVDYGAWKFPLRDGEDLVRDGDTARQTIRDEYQRLREIRRPHGRLRQDPLYQLYSERWLESVIVQDPKLLDRELRAAPVYAQVPAYVTRRRVIDLVAVTESGRLVVIEVKVQKAMNLLFQGLSYWRIVWQAQQQDAFHANGYFSGIVLRDEPPLLYCVTPLLLLHPEERHFARRLPPEVQAYLLGINNDWRSGLRVLRKERLC